MTQALSIAIRRELGRYLARKMDLRAFMDWFAAATWDLPPGTDKATEDLVGEVLLRWAELTNGDRTEEEFRTMLAQSARAYDMALAG